ncbi:class I SAM-dependent methyltransferase [Salipiger sp. P9]|uniref:class I SAM-dependent methyltransferase n=1 Tax=Salipiger pentaromativorans TaxID=2943193 RepID=UPI002157C25E|nr:class I SAM-dependent methyltransferase [Salipiger pentaromativorans]MCR8548716.1 class I SAM-dependent methyltransferase [Salipiger pentaromativorans]
MHLDVQTLRDFYYRSALGRAAQRVVRDQVQSFWPDAQGQTVAGYGFAVPLLRPYLPGARRVVGLMPAPQGVLHWPAGQPNVTVLCEETLWPLETGHVDRLVMMHGLETSERPSELLEECYRVLGPGGEALFIVPNRSGLWARSDATPFGYGRPYSLGQLDAQLKQHDFVRQGHVSVLYQPPSSRRFWMRTAPAWERIGRAIPAVVAGGVLIVRVAKRYPPQRKGLGDKVRVPNPLDVLAPSPKKEPKAV